MTTSIYQQESVSKLNHVYSISWIIEDIKSLGPNSLRTPVFLPIPCSDATFYFELWYQCSGEKYQERSHFKIIFSKSSGANIPQSIKMNVTLGIYYILYDTCPIKKYEHNDVNVDQMDSILITDEFQMCYVYNAESKTHQPNTSYFRLTDCSKITFKCQLLFYDHLGSPTDYFREMRLLKNLKEFAADFEHIYNPSFSNDIYLKIENELLPAHKSILSAHSIVFRRKICSDFLESQTNSIAINDSSPEIFKCFLKYLYSAEIEDKSWPVVKELFMLADKYEVCTLRNECTEILSSLISVENVCEILKMADNHDDLSLKQKACIFAFQNFHEIFMKEDWKKLIQSNPLIVYEVMKNFVQKLS